MELLIGLIVLLIVLLGLAWMSVAAVPEGMHYTVERLGRFQRVLTPGRRVVLPFVERVGARIDVRENLLVMEPQTVATADGQRAIVHLNVVWQVLDVAKAAYEVADHPTALQTLVADTLRSEVASHRLIELTEDRPARAEAMRREIDGKSRAWGIAVREVELANVVTEVVRSGA